MDRHQTGIFGIADKAHGLSRYSEPIFHFRTNGKPGKISSEGIRNVPVMLMSAVVTHIISQKTGTDADFNLFHDISLNRERF